MIFTFEQARSIRQGKMTAALVPITERVRAGSVRVLRRWPPPGEDELHEPVVVADTTPDGERIAVLFTVLAVRELGLEELTLANARACACGSTAELRAAWTLEHRRSTLARMIWFALGDLRDIPRLVSRGWPDYTADESRAMFGEPEALSSFDQEGLSVDAQQRWLRHRADMERSAARSSISDRLIAIQAGTVVAVR